jgi:stage II sporulation protein D
MKLLTLIFSLFFCLTVNAADNSLESATRLKNDFKYKEASSVLSAYQGRDIETLRYLGKTAVLAGQDVEAWGIYASFNEKDWRDYFYIGLAYESSLDNTKAIGAYNESLRQRENTLSLYRLAKIYYKQGDYQQSLKFFSRVVELDKSIRLAYYYMGECYTHISDYQKSHAYLQKALNFYPENKTISTQLESSKVKLGNDFFSKKHKEKEQKRKEFKLPAYNPEKNCPFVRVGIATGAVMVSFKAGEDFSATDGKTRFLGQANKFYSIEQQRGVLLLRDYKTGKVLRRFCGNLKLRCKNCPFYIFDVAVGSGNFWHKQVDMILRGELEFLNKKNSLSLINILTVEDYVRGVLPAEISPNSSTQTLMAQAVAARTIAIRSLNRHVKNGFDVCSDVHCQAYQGMLSETKSTNSAVEATRGRILTYDEKPIDAYYHSNCGGCLRDEVFGARVPFLKVARDWNDRTFDSSLYAKEVWFTTCPKDNFSYRNSSTYRWQRVYDDDDFYFITGRHLTQLKAVKLGQESVSGHYGEIILDFDKEKVKLDRDLDIRNYFDGLRSSAFRMEIKGMPDAPKFMILWGAGFGHGAGLSQEGAMSMGEQGYGYEDILKHYYPEATIKKAY